MQYSYGDIRTSPRLALEVNTKLAFFDYLRQAYPKLKVTAHAAIFIFSVPSPQQPSDVTEAARDDDVTDVAMPSSCFV